MMGKIKNTKVLNKKEIIAFSILFILIFGISYT